jgi:hypothetical protein
MELTEIKQRIAEIGERLGEIAREQAQSGAALARAQGTDWDKKGIAIDPLTKWARRMRELNTEVNSLTAERMILKSQKRALTPCECVCH